MYSTLALLEYEDSPISSPGGSRRLFGESERLLTGSNGNLPSARAARNFCGEKGSNRSEARLASRSSQYLSFASAGGDVLGGRRLLQSYKFFQTL